MGLFSFLFKKKAKLTQEQVEEIDDKVEETQIKHIKDRAILSDLKKPIKIVKKPVKKKKAVKSRNTFVAVHDTE